MGTIVCHNSQNCGVPGLLRCPKNHILPEAPKTWCFRVTEMCQESNLAEMVKIVAFLGGPDAQDKRFGQKMSKLSRSWVVEKCRNHILPNR